MRRTLLFCVLFVSTLSFAQTPLNTTWKYSSDTDKMSSEIDYVASIYSDGKEYPPSIAKYPAHLLVENTGGINLFALIIAKGGEFEREYSDSTNILLRFDDEKPEVYAFAFQSKINSQTVYRDYNSAKGLIEKLKKAKYLKIKFGLSENETGAVGFDVSNFKWDHVGTMLRPPVVH